VQVFSAAPLNPRIQMAEPDQSHVSNMYISFFYLYGSTNLRAAVSLAIWGDNRWAPQVYSNSASWHEAAPIWVYAGHTTSVRIVLQQLAGSLRVLSPSHTSVVAYDWESGMSADSATGSDMLLGGLRAGQYSLEVDYCFWHNQRGIAAMATPVTVAGGQVSTAIVTETSAVIACSAVAANDPATIVSNVYIDIEGPTGQGNYSTDGTYCADGLPPASYTIRCKPYGSDAGKYLETYYDRAHAAQQARRIELWGAISNYYVVHLLPAQAVVQGTATVETAGATVYGVAYTFTSTNGMEYTTDGGSGGSYVIGLPAGAYTMRAYKKGYLDWYYPGVDSSNAAALLSIASGSVNQVNCTLSRGASIQGSGSNLLISSDYEVLACAFPANMERATVEKAIAYRSSLLDQPYSVVGDQYGNFSIMGVPTNSYRIYAGVRNKAQQWAFVSRGAFYPSNDWAGATIITVAHRYAALSNLNVSVAVAIRMPITTNALALTVIDNTGQPIENARVQSDLSVVSSDCYGAAPAETSNSITAPLVVARPGYLSVTTAVPVEATSTVVLQRTSMVNVQLDVRRCNMFWANWCLVTAQPDGRILAWTWFTDNGLAALNVPPATNVLLLASEQAWPDCAYAGTFLGDTITLSNATALSVPDGVWTNVAIRLQSRPESLVTSVLHEAGATVSVQCLDVPTIWHYDDSGWLTQRLAWTTWSMPSNAMYDTGSRMFSWVSDGSDCDTYIGRLQPPGADRDDPASAGTLIQLRVVPEPCSALWLVIGYVLRRRAKAFLV
jgi:hypothetical protein